MGNGRATVRVYLMDMVTDGELRENILRTYLLSTATERAEGRSWYHAAHTFATGLGRKYEVTRDQAIGVIAALSPGLRWERNMLLAEQLIRTGDAAHPYGNGTGNGPLVQARRVLAGEPFLDVCGPKAYKTRAFYDCIQQPYSGDGPVVVDRHALSLAVGVKLGESETKALGRVGAYQRIAAAYRAVAETQALLPSQLQAITWVTWRRLRPAKDPVS